MTEAGDRFREVDGRRDKERWRLFVRLVKMESKKNRRE